jgi:Fe2+ or Zn2+ uptake regulation protein
MVKKRNTLQKEVLQKALESIDTFFSAEELLLKVMHYNKNIGIATVYRFLKQAKRSGKLYSYECNRRTIYSKDNKSHCHFICENTGKIIHFEIDSLDFLKDKIPGTIKSFQIEVRGVCSDCCKR